MVIITRATVRANIFELLYDSLTSSLSKGTVTAAFISDQPTYPQVVINPARIGQENLVLNRGTTEYTGEVEIELFTQKAKDIDEIADEINEDLIASESSLASSGFYLNDVEDGIGDTFFWNKQKIHTKSLLLSYNLNL
jgi:hypothetical protein